MSSAIDRRDLWQGLRVIWRHTPRGGYGFTIRIPVTVVAVNRPHGRIRVKVERTGDLVDVALSRLVIGDFLGIDSSVSVEQDR